jgi:hypothetical protein
MSVDVVVYLVSMYVAYLGGFVVIIVGLVGVGVVVMRMVVMRRGRSLL